MYFILLISYSRRAKLCEKMIKKCSFRLIDNNYVETINENEILGIDIMEIVIMPFGAYQELEYSCRL